MWQWCRFSFFCACVWQHEQWCIGVPCRWHHPHRHWHHKVLNWVWDITVLECMSERWRRKDECGSPKNHFFSNIAHFRCLICFICHNFCIISLSLSLLPLRLLGNQPDSDYKHKREVMTHFDLLLLLYTMLSTMFHSSVCIHPCLLSAKSLSMYVLSQPKGRASRPSWRSTDAGQVWEKVSHVFIKSFKCISAPFIPITSFPFTTVK